MSTPGHLHILHAVRVLGYADTARISERTGAPHHTTEELLLTAQAAGQVTWSRFEDEGGWSLTDAGKTEDERLLARELDRLGVRTVIEAAMADFEPLNDLVVAACTRWQLAEMGITPTGLPDVLTDLNRAADGLAKLEDRLVAHVARFQGYHDRFTVAVEQAATDPAWITATDRDSAHQVWFQLHEDLLATLGRSR